MRALRLGVLLAGAVSCAKAGEPVAVAVYTRERPARGGVESFTLAFGPREDGGFQWVRLEADKGGGAGRFQVWMLRDQSGRKVRRYVLEENGRRAREYRHPLTGEAVLPSMGGWEYLWPRPVSEVFAPRVEYLGHTYHLGAARSAIWTPPPANARVVELRPDLWIGPASNTRQKDERRRYDGSDYALIPLTRDDYAEMAEAGITCVRAVGQQQEWAEEAGLHFWGPHEPLPYPELLYRSQYLGPYLFLDEPAVVTRDHDLRPRLAKYPEYRKAMSPREALRAYQERYMRALREGPAQALIQTLAKRADVDLGTMRFDQANLYNWETMVSTAAWALGQDARVPSAMVFEPPGRIGTRRTLPEWNMSYGTQFRADDPRVLPAVVFGFLRGAARLSGKEWGVSIYGAVERADTFWWLTHAYDLGATRFHFWDNHQLACVPYGEVLTLSRHLRAHARQHPRRVLAGPAERAILLPPGYDLGHVQMGRGSLWGIGELNLERVNRKGVKHRVVMSRFFAEIERSLQQAVAFDLLWDLEGLRLEGYREVVRVRENGEVEGSAGAPGRVAGVGPSLSVTLAGRQAKARVTEGISPVYYTTGADRTGILHNAMVLWELFGPDEEDYLFLQTPEVPPLVRQVGLKEYEVRLEMPQLKPGRYRLRAATVDVSGRTAVVWREFEAAGGER